MPTGSRPDDFGFIVDSTSSFIICRQRREVYKSAGQLSCPFFNRHTTRSLHPTVLASGDTSAHRQRMHLHLRHGGFDVALVQGASCNPTFFQGSFCKTVA
jgi:hypothetical protein